MKKTAILIVLFSLVFGIWADNGEIIDVKSVLFIACDKALDVYLDSRLVGQTPLTLTGIKPGLHNLEIKNDSLYAIYVIKILEDAAGLSVIIAEPEVYKGSIAVNTEPSGAEVYIDGKFTGHSPLTVDNIPAGESTVRIMMDGYQEIGQKTDVPQLGKTDLSVKLQKLYNVRFEPELPVDTELTLIDNKTKNSFFFSGNGEVWLASGAYSAEISSSQFEKISIEFKISESDIKVPLSVNIFSPELVIEDIPRNTIIFIDGLQMESGPGTNTFTLLPGNILLKITRKNFLPISDNVILEGNSRIVYLPEFKKDTEALKKVNDTLGWSFLIGGSALTLGGLVVNYDGVSTLITSSYSEYSDLKYISLGIAGSGLAIALTGLGFLIF